MRAPGGGGGGGPEAGPGGGGGGGGPEAGPGDAPAPRAELDGAAAARRGGCGAHGGDADVAPKLREDLGSTLVGPPAPRPTALERESSDHARRQPSRSGLTSMALGDASRAPRRNLTLRLLSTQVGCGALEGGGDQAEPRAPPPPLPPVQSGHVSSIPPSRTKWTRLVHPSVLIGHAPPGPQPRCFSDLTGALQFVRAAAPEGGPRRARVPVRLTARSHLRVEVGYPAGSDVNPHPPSY
jgi:hypothetical protein